MNLFPQNNFKKLAKIEEIDLPAVAAVIKERKIGQGLKFLPRKLTDLTTRLQIWLKEFAETGASGVRNKIAAVLEELLRQKGITQERYKSIKNENDIA